jgi:tRNA (guanosine-2'-O-)-methyltransferase
MSSEALLTGVDPGRETSPALAELTAPWPSTWDAGRIIEKLEPLVLARRRTRFNEVIAGRLGSVTLLLDELSDPHNRAAIVGSCDAFGVQELHSVQPATSFAIHHGVAAGTERWVDVNAHPDARSAVDQLQSRGFELIQTHPKGELTPDDLAQVPRVALILGNEHRGIDPVLLAAAPRGVRIPMRGFVESLNVSVSAAVLLAAATRGRGGDLPPDARQHLYARALFYSVPRAGEVLEAFEQRTAPPTPPVER